jgi:hypothetical protein
MSDMTPVSTVTLPPGVSIVGNKETSQTSATGQIVQGQQFILRLPNGSQTSVFIPYFQLGNPTFITSVIAEQVGNITAVLNAASG